MRGFFLRLFKWLGAVVLALFLLIAGVWLWIAAQMPPLQTMLNAPIPVCEKIIPPSSSSASIEPWHVAALYAVENVDRYAARSLAMENLPNDRTISRMVRTAVWEQFIKLRLNRAETAQVQFNRGYFGKGGNGLACAAAIRYDKQVADLSLAQFAMLIGLIKGPSAYDPGRHPDRALKRRNDVLDIWLAKGIASQAQVDAAKLEPL